MGTTDLPTSDFFASESFAIDEPYFEWNDNHRIRNGRGQTLFARRSNGIVRLIAAVFGTVVAVALALILSVISLRLFRVNDHVEILVAIPTLLVGIVSFAYLRGRRNISIYADSERREQVFTIRQDNILYTPSPKYSLQTTSGIVGSVQRHALTMVGEGWKILDANGAVVAEVKEDVANALVGDLTILKEGRNDIVTFRVTDANGKAICNLRKGVFNLVQTYGLELERTPAFPPSLLVALVLVLDITFYVNNRPERKGLLGMPWAS